MIGLGRMGSNMARRLKKGGHECGLINLLREKLIEHKRHISLHGEDRPEIRDCKWEALR